MEGLFMKTNFRLFLLILALAVFQACSSTDPSLEGVRIYRGGTARGTTPVAEKAASSTSTFTIDGTEISALGALGRLEAASSGPLFSGDGGKNIRLAVIAPQVHGEVPAYLPIYIQGLLNNNFSKYSAISMIDRQNLDRIISEQKIAASGNYSENDFVRIGNLANAQYFLFGTIQKLSGERYAVQLSVTDSSTGVRRANFMREGTLAQLEGRGTLINEATADLLAQLGIQLTETGRQTLLAGNTSVARAEAGLARGITAQAGGSEIEALFNFTQAITFDPSRIEALSRLNTLSSTISGGTISQRILSDIQARDSWLNAFKETARFFNDHPPFEIIFDPNLIQIGQTDYAKRTANIGMRIVLEPSEAGFGALNALLEGLERTGRRRDWGFSGWPLTDVTPKTTGTVVFDGRRSLSYKVDVALINENNKTIGNGSVTLNTETIKFSAGDRQITPPGSVESVVNFSNVKADDLTPTLTIVIAAVNGISSRNLNASGYMKIETGDLENRYEKSALVLLASGIKSVVDARDYDQAIADFTQAINLNSNLASAYILRGRALHASVLYVLYTERNFSGFGAVWYDEDQKEARLLLNKALEDLNYSINLDPNNANAYLERGKIYYFLKDYDKSLVDINQAIRLNQNYAMAYNFRSYYYSGVGADYDKALEDINRAIRLEPNEGWHYNRRGIFYNNFGDNDKAISDFTQAIRLDPNNAVYYAMRGDYYYNDKDDYDKAIADYTLAIRLDPNNAYYYISRSDVYFAKKDYDRAIADYTQAIRINPNDAYYYKTRGDLYYAKKDYDLAIADYTRAIRLDPNNAEYHNKRGNLYYAKKDYDLAIANYTQAIKLDPNTAFFYNDRGVAYYAKNAYNWAMMDFAQASRIEPNNTTYRQNLEKAQQAVRGR
jgi:tetratricopeptide (TPR) repeat protein